MKKIFLLSFLILISTLVSFTGVIAATYEPLTGQPESPWVNSRDAFTVWWHDARNQSIYLASELSAVGMPAGDIASIQVKISETPGIDLNNFRVRMQQTASTQSTAWVTTGWTTLYGPTNISTGSLVPGNWYTFNLSTPLTWDGTSNLLIDFSRDGSAYHNTGGGIFIRGSLTWDRTVVGYSDSSYVWPFDSMPSAINNIVPSIRFISNVTPNASSVTDAPDPVDVGNNITFTGNWTESDSGDNVKMYVCKDSTCSNCNNASQTNCWCYSSAWNTEPDTSDTCSYAVQAEDAGNKSYWLGVCDGYDACDATPLAGGMFTVPNTSAYWAMDIGNPDLQTHEYIRTLLQTADGEYIVAGYSWGYGSGPNGQSDALIMKLDSNGNQIWGKTYGEAGVDDGIFTSISTTSDGGYIGAGTFSGADIIRLDSNGDRVWAKDFAGVENINDIKQTADGGYIMAGYQEASFANENNTNLVIKLDSNGNQVWTETYGGTYSFAHTVIEDADGNYVVGGETTSYGAGNNDILLVKFNSSGDKVWARTVGGASRDRFGVASFDSGLIQAADGGYVVTGYTLVSGSYKFLIVKVDSNGDYLWDKAYGGAVGDQASSIQQTSDGGYIIAGFTKSYGAGNADFLVLKIDSVGNQEWAKTIGGADNEYPYSIRQTSDGGYIVGGGSSSYVSGDNSNWLLVKLDSIGNIPGGCADLQNTTLLDFSPTIITTTPALSFVSSFYADSSVTPTSFSVSPASSIVCPEGAAVPNVPPAATSVSDDPDPVDAGNNITFTGNWTESNAGDNVKMYVCASSTCFNCNNSTTSGCWCSSAAWNTEPDTTDTCAYTAQAEDAGNKSYWLGVCDGYDACDSTPLAGGTFTVNVPASPPDVSTNIANSINRFSAQLNGSLTDLGGAATSTVWFEWEQSDVLPAIYNHTIPAVDPIKSTTGAFYANLSGLDPDTDYYFRAAAQNSAGTNYGDGEPFTTDAHNPPTIDSVSISTADENICKIDGASTVCKSGETITFESVAPNDPDGDTVFLYICKDETCTSCHPEDRSNCWTVSVAGSANNPLATYDSSIHVDSNCEYSLNQEYWAKVCDQREYCSDVIGKALDEEICNALAGWHWYTTNGRSACWSKTLADSVSWNKGVGNDTDNPGVYTCVATPADLTDRMTAASAGEWYKIVSNVAGTNITVSHNGSAGYSVISALAISDCLDGTRDLCTGDGCLGANTTAVNISLRTWASAVNDKSALPYCAGSSCNSSANSDWRAACEQSPGNDLPLDCSDGFFYKNRKVCNDGDANYGHAAAAHTSTLALALGFDSCSLSYAGNTSFAAAHFGFRVVVRP